MDYPPPAGIPDSGARFPGETKITESCLQYRGTAPRPDGERIPLFVDLAEMTEMRASRDWAQLKSLAA